MEYMDEKIIELRHLREKELHASIETGFLIDHKLIEFEPVELFDGKVEIMQPAEFVPMPPHLVRAKYQSENRPQLIRTSLDTEVNFTFSLFPAPLSGEEAAPTARQAADALKKVNPAFQFYDRETEPLGNSQIAWFDYKTYGLDDQLYNIMAVTPIGVKLFHIGFNCRFRLMNEWKPAVRQVLLSIRDLTGTAV